MSVLQILYIYYASCSYCVVKMLTFQICYSIAAQCILAALTVL